MESSTGRPHSDDNLRWFELFLISGLVHYVPEDYSIPEMTVDEFMDDVERRLELAKRKRNIKEGENEWICNNCGKSCAHP